MKAILKMDEGSKVIVDLLTYPPPKGKRDVARVRGAHQVTNSQVAAENGSQDYRHPHFKALTSWKN